MKKFNIWTVALLLIISVSTFANTPPGNIQSTFKKMYPTSSASTVYRLPFIMLSYPDLTQAGW